MVTATARALTLRNSSRMFLFRRRQEKTGVTLSPRDIHNHLLPGVDDGFQYAEDSLKAIGIMAEHGVKEIVFTPHMNPDVYPDESEKHFREVYEGFRQMIPAELGLTTSLAAEYMVVKDFEQRASDPELLTYDDGSILIEMSYYFRSPNLEKAVFELCMAGKKPIIAHPERYLYMAGCLEDFDRLADMGCRFQMNFMSLSGAYGPQSLRILDYLRDKGLYSFVATDLHTIPQLEKILAIKTPGGRTI